MKPVSKRWTGSLWDTCSAIAGGAEKLGSTAAMLMMLLTVTDIILRRFFNSPLPFSFEVVEFLLVLVAYGYIAYTTSVARHVAVETLTSSFPPAIRKHIRDIGDFLTIILFGLISWQNVLQGINVMRMGATTAILHIPKFPFQFFVAFGSALACLILLARVINSFNQGKDTWTPL